MQLLTWSGSSVHHGITRYDLLVWFQLYQMMALEKVHTVQGSIFNPGGWTQYFLIITSPR